MKWKKVKRKVVAGYWTLVSGHWKKNSIIDLCGGISST
jgi:hypothetical protein